MTFFTFFFLSITTKNFLLAMGNHLYLEVSGNFMCFLGEILVCAYKISRYNQILISCTIHSESLFLPRLVVSLYFKVLDFLSISSAQILGFFFLLVCLFFALVLNFSFFLFFSLFSTIPLFFLIHKMFFLFLGNGIGYPSSNPRQGCLRSVWC